jgi:hypothetical protein
MDGLQFDRILVTAFFSALVAFVTAAMSIVRLVNDKESKTTDCRQGWRQSLRTSFSELISSLNAGAAAMDENVDVRERKDSLEADIDKETVQKRLEDLRAQRSLIDKQLHDLDDHFREVRQNVYRYYALVALHFSSSDSRIQQLNSELYSARDLLNRVGDLYGTGSVQQRAEIRSEVGDLTTKITAHAQTILDSEWNTVKRGESIYVWTKYLSIVFLSVSFFLMLFFRLGECCARAMGNVSR